MTGYKTGDEMVFRGDIEEPFREMVEASMRRTHFTPEKAYRIRIQGRYILTLDDCGEEWGFATDPEDSYYYARFFYTKGEIRDMKLGGIGI
jgi:hypothetical protein